MNEIPTVDDVIEGLNTADWSDTTTYSVDDAPRPSLTDPATTVTGALRAKVKGVVYKIEITAISVDPATAKVTHRVPYTDWAGKPAGLYDWSFTEHLSDGSTNTLLTGKYLLKEGPEE